MSDLAIRKFLMEKASALEREADLDRKVPTDMLAIIKFEDGSSHVIYPNDRILCLGLSEGLKETLAEL